MIYQYSHFDKQIAVSLEEKHIVVRLNNKAGEKVRHVPYMSIEKIHLSSSGPDICRCNLFFTEDNYRLSLSSFNIYLKPTRTHPEQLDAYRLFVEALHQKILTDKGLKQNVSFVCGNSAKMWFYIAIIATFMAAAVPMAISIGRYELLLVPFGAMGILLFQMRKTGFTRPYNPKDSDVMLQFLPVAK